MDCICSPTISVLWNREVTTPFWPSCGIRQGDPLSPYIFILCMERLSRNIGEKVSSGIWKPIRLGDNVDISHIFYADDVFLFGQASQENGEVISKVLEDFGNESGLKVNMAKSTIIFPPKMNHQRRRILASSLGMRGAASFGKYLGIPIIPNKLKRSEYGGLLEKVKSSIRGWQLKFFNMAGRCTLIKSVISSFPVYGMPTTILPIAITNEIKKECRRFLWNKVDKTHYLSRLSWDIVCSSSNYGGLGFRKLHQWNLAFMAKLGWTILKNEDKLWVKLSKTKYWRRGTFLNAQTKGHHSPIWKDISKGREILEKGSRKG